MVTIILCNFPSLIPCCKRCVGSLVCFHFSLNLYQCPIILYLAPLHTAITWQHIPGTVCLMDLSMFGDENLEMESICTLLCPHPQHLHHCHFIPHVIKPWWFPHHFSQTKCDLKCLPSFFLASCPSLLTSLRGNWFISWELRECYFLWQWNKISKCSYGGWGFCSVF